MTMTHGGNVYEVAAALGCLPQEILDFSASINPLGPPPGVHRAMIEAFPLLQHYPDIHNRALTEAIAAHHGLDPAWVVAGNGSTELIYWLPRALGIRKALVILPTFSEYPKAFQQHGLELDRLVTTAADHFQPTVEALERAVGESSPQAVLFTHPGSPSGTLLSPAVRGWLLEESLKGRFMALVDEVFVDFCEEESLKGFLVDSDRLVLIRSMTKFYGLPGLRLGYLLTSPSLAGRLRECLPPWSLNTLAQAAGPHCFREKGYRKETLELIGRERARMAAFLESLRGFRVFPGRANYLLVELADGLPPAGRLQQDLLVSDRLLVRDCSSFEGLSERYVRVAVRLPEENQRLLRAVERWVGAHSQRVSSLVS